MMTDIINILPDGQAQHAAVPSSSGEKLITNASRSSSSPSRYIEFDNSNLKKKYHPK